MIDHAFHASTHVLLEPLKLLWLCQHDFGVSLVVPHTVGLPEILAKSVCHDAKGLRRSKVDVFREAERFGNRRVIHLWVLRHVLVCVDDAIGVASQPILNPVLQLAHRCVLVISVQHEHLRVLRDDTLGGVDHFGTVETLSAIKELD